MKTNCTRFDGESFKNITSTPEGHVMGAMAAFNMVWNRVIFSIDVYIFHWTQGWAKDGTASPKDFCPWDWSLKPQNPGTVPKIFVPVLSKRYLSQFQASQGFVSHGPRNSGICVPGLKSHGVPLTIPFWNTPMVEVNFELCKNLCLKLVYKKFEFKIIRHPLFSEVKVNTMRLILDQFIFFNLFLTRGHGLVLQLCLSQCASFLLWLLNQVQIYIK